MQQDCDFNSRIVLGRLELEPFRKSIYFLEVQVWENDKAPFLLTVHAGLTKHLIAVVYSKAC